MNCKNPKCDEPKCAGACGDSISYETALGEKKAKNFLDIRNFLNEEFNKLADKHPDKVKELMKPINYDFKDEKEAYIILKRVSIIIKAFKS